MVAPKLSQSLVVDLWSLSKPIPGRLTTIDQRLPYFFAVALLPTAFLLAGAFALAFAFGLRRAAGFAAFSPVAGVTPLPTGTPFLFFSASTISRCAMRRT